MVNNVIRTVEKYLLLERGDKVLIALSGGPDSMFLLHILKSIQRLYKLEFVIAHFNHSLRKRADRDAEFVREVSKEQGISCIITKKDVKNYARKHCLCLEEGARKLRYDFLEKSAIKVGANKIATGHTLTDEAETFIMRVVRGTGTKGLSLIPPKRGKIIRPLIEIEHSAILRFLKAKKIRYRQDYSNYNLNRTRNFIRYRIMPEIYKLAPDFGKKTMRLRDIVEAEERLMDKITEARLKEISKYSGGKIEITSSKFLKEDIAIQRRIVRKFVQESAKWREKQLMSDFCVKRKQCSSDIALFLEQSIPTYGVTENILKMINISQVRMKH